MMGKTHLKIGVLSYCIILTIPLFTVIPYVTTSGISLVQIIIAGIATLMPDADSQHSYINRLNPATGVANKAIDTAENILIKAVTIAFTIGIGLLIIISPGKLIQMLMAMGISSSKSKILIYGIGILLSLLGLIGVKGERILKRIPFVGNIYKSVIKGIKKVATVFRKYALMSIYIGAGIWIIFYNFNKYNDLNLYLIGLIFIGIAIFPHRSFLHSIEGLVALTMAVSYLSNKIGYPQATPAFFIGYFSHLYLADIFTKEGIPLSILPRILKKTGLHTYLRKSKIYMMIYRILDIRLVVPVMSTGSKKGNIIEASYVLALLAILIVSVVRYDVAIRFL
ncbi:metal-dependent hydrolase [Alkaliphilus sp. MSJ-5]|uniref:Metal-dependent hydrolase n=1 Tax=Alkaliphilus flagellatus TaxID=2841507 RepID=A0ABS6G083_9FIRM|nr:metal-dependent hydrolase [Alkaliphilus flagellatus]MBU5675768.1 metal-dependent hydrolase [Alkaliphilus flagellatus]